MVDGNIATIAENNLIIVAVVARIANAARDVVWVRQRRGEEFRSRIGQFHVRREKELLVFVLVILK